MSEDKRFLRHVENLRGRGGQGGLPRYRKRDEPEQTNKYAFACRLKKAPRIWLVIHQDFWGFMPAEQFNFEYVTSNDCSREQRLFYARLDAKENHERST